MAVTPIFIAKKTAKNKKPRLVRHADGRDGGRADGGHHQSVHKGNKAEQHRLQRRRPSDLQQLPIDADAVRRLL